MPRKPTDKQKAFVAAKLRNPDVTDTEAALQAGYSINTAHNVGVNVVAQPGTLSLLEKFGIAATVKLNDEFILNTVASMMEAEKIDHSHTEPDRIVPDWDARDKGVKHAVAIRGLVQQQPTGGNSMFVNFGGLKDKYTKE
jgi:phage terminase small subunit